ncbi:MAG: 2-isopropylmalate synthase [Vallitaleaceae bacterium]|nr:2-isopropylmalate synthase [Vallitaleaceae bacterium]
MKVNKNITKYKAYPVFQFNERTWPAKKLEVPPVFCSVDLRDGNQALPNPMGIDAKLRFFDLLVEMGFKEIEIGFPSASDTEYNFLRRLIEENRIPLDVKVQVLVQAREHLISKTFEALKGVHAAIVHVYNSTSTLQRDVVFQKSKEEIKAIAKEGAQLLVDYAAKYPETRFTFQYSPESFTGTEMDYALEVVEAVIDVWQPTVENKAIVNLPATVEMTTPNVFADQVEWFSKNMKNRDCVMISLHTHNDRGTSVAATELGILAGADRVEGTLFGNGERTGNLDLYNLAMNYYSQGIEPNIYVEEVNRVIETYESCTGLFLSDRHPYAGKLVYTAFSGSHQDAIRKGLSVYEKSQDKIWEIPYLPIDPADIGRLYEPIIRINSQSGKGGIAYILESEFGYKAPKAMHPEIAKKVQSKTDELGRELSNQEILEIFEMKFVNSNQPHGIHSFSYAYNDQEKDSMIVHANVTINGVNKDVSGKGNGPVSAFFNAIRSMLEGSYELVSYDEHALSDSANAEAAAYIQLKNQEGIRRYGVGRDSNIDSASIRAIMSALNNFEEK